MIRQFLDLSTAHLSPAALTWLDEAGWLNAQANHHQDSSGGAAISTLGSTYAGWFMHVPHPDLDGGDMGGMPDDLKAICKFANDRGCSYALFDAEGPILADLPILDPDLDAAELAPLVGVGDVEKTFDFTQEAFLHSPNRRTAGDYLAAAMEYEADDMIGDDTFLNALADIRGWLQAV